MPQNSVTQNRAALQTGEGCARHVTGSTNSESPDPPQFSNLDGQEMDWNSDGLAFNLTSDYIDWPGDFATFRSDNTREFL
jgi:hypothetical protein